LKLPQTNQTEKDTSSKPVQISANELPTKRKEKGRSKLTQTNQTEKHL
jgi:hypothetical protein